MEVVGAAFVLGNVKAAAGGRQATPSKAAVKSARKGAKGGKKGQKWLSKRIVVAANDDGDNKEASNSGEEYVVTTERDVKRQAWQPRDHFERLLKATCLNHLYPIKHKLKDCTIIKNFMTSWALSRGRKPEGDLGGKDMTPIP
jgi:hypothetical protein